LIAAAKRQRHASTWLAPQQLAAIDRLELVARHVIAGYLAGMHRSASIGASTEFAEHRSYTPGDDIRRIDWRVYGRTDRLMVKSFQAESNADVMLVIDRSASMSFSSIDVSKLHYARMLAASIAHLASKQRDRVGLAFFDTALQHFMPPSSLLDEGFWHTLDAPAEPSQTDMAAAATDLARRLHRRAMVVVMSDFYQEPDAVTDALACLSARHEVVALHVQDPGERVLPWQGAQVLADAETGIRIAVDAARGKSELMGAMDAHSERLAARLHAIGAEYQLIHTEQKLELQLHALLHRRTKRAVAKGGSRRRRPRR
jgi:uncharacterized protein (DUF58 family)